ncbi:MAG: T9SS type A sorting domain-containing protein [Saprospiraceae bacterium]
MKLISTKELMLLVFLFSFPAFLFSMEKNKTTELSDDKEVLSKSEVSFSLFLAETNPSCMSCMNGSISTLTVGGFSPYTYSWSNGATISSLNNLGIGTYTVSVTDILGCQEIGTVTLNAGMSVLEVEVSTLGVGCYGDSTGNAVAQVTNGMMPFQYLWSNGDTTSTSSNLPQGNYNMTVTDATGATASDDFMITSPDSLIVTAQAIVGCEGGTSGSATANVSGGSFPFSYAWSNGDSVQTATNLSTGNYVVTVTDINGCEAISSAVFLDQPIEVNSNPSPSSTSCPGGMDGSVTLDVWGGAGGYTFNWSNGATTQNITNVLAGPYSVTVTDTNGCTSSSETNVDSPSPITLNVQGIGNVTCNGESNGSIFADAFGGNPGYTYVWNNGATGSFIDSLGAGTYFATITDATGCTGIGSVTVNEPEILETFTFGSSVCNGSDDGTANVVVSGGTQPFFYAWSTGATTPEIENLTPGTYYVTVNDVNQCIVEDSITINLNANILTSNPSSTMVSCPAGNDGTATIIPSGGNAPYTYQWSTGSMDSVITNLMAGSYTVTVVDFFNCSFVETYDISQPNPVDANATVVNTNCGMQNGIIYLNPTGGTSPYTFEWANGSNADSLANLDSGAYAVNVTDANGCVKQFFVDVLMGNNPPNAVTQNISVSLNDLGIASIDVTQINNGSSDDCGIDTLFIDLNNFDCSDLGENTVTLTVSDEEGATSTETAIVTILDEIAPTAITQNITLSLDENGIATLAPNQVDNGSSDNCGIDSMNVSIMQFDCSNIGDNSVMLTVLDASGNSNSAEAIITIIDDLAPTIITQNVTIYLDDMGMAQIDPNQINIGSSDNCGIDSISIDISQFDCSTLGENTVTLTAIDASGNMQSDTAIITVADSIFATFSCPPDLLIESCDSVIILDYTLGDVIDNCSVGDPILISGIPSGGELSAGTVTNVFEYTDQAGNVTTCSFDITLSTVPEIEIQLDSSIPATDGNSDGSIEITITSGTGPFQFEWTSNGVIVSTDEDPTGLPAGNYEVLVTGVNGCVTTFQVEVTTEIQDPELVAKVNLFPNPTSDILFVKMDLPIESGDKIQLYSIDGKVLLEKTLNDGDELIEMNVANFTNGIYIMQLTVNQGVITKRVIID